MNTTMRHVMLHLTADKKKLSLMVALLAVALLLWGRLMLKQVPRTAVAVPAGASVAINPATDTDTSLIGEARPIIYVSLSQTLNRDIFVPDAALYQHEEQTGPDTPVTNTTKLPNQVTDDPSSGLEDLLLQTTMLGETPRAMINGKGLTAGQKIRGFTVIEVRSRQVTLEKNGVKFYLKM